MSRLTRALSVRPGEGRPVVLVAAAFAAIEMGRGLGEVGVDTLVLSRTGADALPPLYVGLGLTGLVVTLGYGAALARSHSERFFPVLLLVLAGVLGVEWLVALSGVEAIFPALWISVYAAGLLLLTAMWTVAGFTFDARQAKRLFPLLTSAAIVGSLAGFLSAIVVQRVVGAEQLILAEALLFVAAGVLLAALGTRLRPRRRAGETTPSVIGALTSGAAYVSRSPLMRLVAVAYVLLAVLMFSVTFPFMTALSEAFPDEAGLLTALALLSAAVTGISFLIGTLLANRLYAWLGVATVALSLPIVYVLGFGLWLVRFTLATAIIVRVAQQVTQRGVSNATWGAFFSVIPSGRRGQVMAFIDGVPGQLGTVISGVLLIVAASLAIEQVFVMGLVAGLLCVGVVYLIRRAYATSLVATLREGLAEQVLEGGPGLAAFGRDAQVVADLRAATRSDRPAGRRLAADLLGQVRATEAVADLEALLDDPEASVRRSALVALSRIGGARVAGQLERGLADPDAHVRCAAVAGLAGMDRGVALGGAVIDDLEHDPSALVRCELAVALGNTGRGSRAQAIVTHLLASEAPAERAAGLDAMARIGDLDGLDPEPIATYRADPSAQVRAAALRAAAAHARDGVEGLTTAFDDPSPLVRTTAALALRQRADATTALVRILEVGSDEAQEAALVALDGHADAVRPALIEWSGHQVARATRLRQHALALGAGGQTPSGAFLAQVVRRRESAIETRLLAALAILGAPEASGLIRRCLRSIDPEVRAQAIEALDALGDARLSRGVVRLLDSEVEFAAAERPDAMAATRAMVEDRDPWVRALALRTLSEHLRDEQRVIAGRVRDDPDPVVRLAVEIEEGAGPMTGQSLQLVSDIDRMLVLRTVPLFEALTPEDLQRVASTAVEHTWGGGEALMTEGDVGDELVVIVEGSVRVVRGGEGGERVLRTFGPGDHIGELAVLREAARAATVVAEDPGVRGLVISGEAVQAILRERPDAAMAMLATLADRISQQA